MKWIQQYIDYKGITVYNFEKKIGTRSTIHKAIKSNSKLRSDILSKIIKVFEDVRAEWLLTGEGNMLKETESKQKLNYLKTPQKKITADPRIYEIQELATQLELTAFRISKDLGISIQTIKNILSNGPRATRSKIITTVLKYLQQKAGHTGTIELAKQFTLTNTPEKQLKITEFSKLSIEEKLNQLYNQLQKHDKKTDIGLKSIELILKKVSAKEKY
jgi:DNA-binding transcriptional MerR regulator